MRVGRPKGKSDNLYKKENEYIEIISDLYSGELEYIKTERKATNLKGKYRYFITTRCVDCGTIRTAGIETYKNGTRCRCKRGKSIRASAKKYALELYRAMNQEKLGMLLGSELRDYVLASITYDRPLMNGYDEYVELVQDFMEDIYEKEHVTKCKSCGIWLPKKNMSSRDKDYCKECYKELR